MRKQILKGIAGIGLLAVLPACSAQKQTVSEDVYALAAGTEQNGMEQAKNNQPGQITRSIVIPQLQVDAQSVYSRMITYIIPEEELAPHVTSEKISAYIDYPAGGVSVNLKYGNNRAVLSKLEGQLAPLIRSENEKVRKIRITGYASPDGSTKENERLAGNRAIQFKNFLQKQLNLSDNSLITVDWAGEDWDGLKELISASDKKYSSRVLAIFQLTNDPDSRRKQIKAIDNGTVYKDIEKTFFSRLRRMELQVETETQSAGQPDNNFHLLELVYSQPEKLSLEEMLQLVSFYRPGTEQYREIYEIAAYTYPSCTVAQLNAAAAALAQGDKDSARYFFRQADGDKRAWNNLGVLALMDGDEKTAFTYFQKYIPLNPRLARENMKLIEK